MPSLYAYNDAVFTEKDWEGVSSLGISGKEKDVLKVGRFGLGFKSVFHLTGMMFLSNFCIIMGYVIDILFYLK